MEVMSEAYKWIVLNSDSHNPMAYGTFGNSLQFARMP